jgi:hypothetical protein
MRISCLSVFGFVENSAEEAIGIMEFFFSIGGIVFEQQRRER